MLFRSSRQIAIKGLVIEDAFTRIGKLDVPQRVRVEGSPEEGYRMRARLHAVGGQVGFFREGTHEPCDPRQTRQLLPATCEVLSRLAAGLRSLGIPEVHDLELSENIDASQRVVHIDADASVTLESMAGLGASDGISGLTLAVPDRGRTRVVVASGDPHVVDRFTLEGAEVVLRQIGRAHV
mgnify:FL=1